MSRTLVEPSSPFVRPQVEEVFVDETAPREPSVAVSILKDPARIADLVSEGAIERVVLSSLVCIAISAVIFTNVTLARSPWLEIVRASVIVPANLLMALAAALGPIYATSVVFAARVPFARLVAVLLSSVATGSMVLAALAPIPWFAGATDPVWHGPIALLAVFAVAGASAGARLRASLLALAERSTDDALSKDALRRVGILARIGFMIVVLTVGVAVWGFDALSPTGWV